MYKTKITTREDIESAIKPIAEAINSTSLGSKSTAPGRVKLEIKDTEFIVNTLEICANKFPDKTNG